MNLVDLQDQKTIKFKIIRLSGKWPESSLYAFKFPFDFLAFSLMLRPNTKLLQECVFQRT